VILLIISVLVSTITGTVKISLSDLFSGNGEKYFILMNIRLPRIINAFFVGSALTCSGYIMQTLLRNNLADSSILGVSAGAGTGAILSFIFFPVNYIYFLTPVSFIFAVLTTILIFIISNKLSSKYSNFISSNKIILSGIAINALLSSINGIILLYSGKNLSQIVFWLNGGLNGKGWQEFYFAIIPIMAGFLLAIYISKDLNIVMLGEEKSVNLGLNLRLLQILSVISCSLLAASAVSIAGIISFIGLIIPNITRLLIGSDLKFSVPFSILFGGFFLIVCDIFSRVLISPSEIPVGVITSLIGAPVFIFLIFKKKAI
jgi:iron complex transport system permease protein